jgi:cytochrome o ubiquinol oxidase subunit IV
MEGASYKSYIIGFLISIGLTLLAYFAVVSPASVGLAPGAVLVAILILAVVQLVVQLFFFLHLGSGEGAGWRTAIFASTIALVLIVVIGSLWIMNHLNYNMMMSPTEMQQYIQSQQGF